MVAGKYRHLAFGRQRAGARRKAAHPGQRRRSRAADDTPRRGRRRRGRRCGRGLRARSRRWNLCLLLAGALGAALGDWLSYWLGQVCKHRIARMWPFSAHPTLLARGEAFIEKWGALAIVIARFSGPLRASVPIAAGMLGMPLRVFQI